ncbi:MAG: LysR family transcriptional regulator ArgP [Angustibacter sp.]
MQLDQLRALVAIADTGSFDAAATALRVTPSAVSQRIKALESSVGHVVVRRHTPCAVTAAGAVLLRMAREVAVLETESRAQLGGGASAMPMAVAVNADSLATWFRPVLGAAATWPDVVLRIELEDESHSVRLLRSGEVVGAVSDQAGPVSGCRAEPLGTMRYLPVATPALRARYARGNHVDWATMPCLLFNAKDDLAAVFLGSRGVEVSPPTPHVPSSTGFRDAVLAGLGWGMLPEAQCTEALADGRLVQLVRAHHDVDLRWHVWRLPSPRIARVSFAIHEAARHGLRRPQARRPSRRGRAAGDG